MFPRTPTATLKNVDLHNADALICAPLKDGGLGISLVTISIPAIVLAGLRT